MRLSNGFALLLTSLLLSGAPEGTAPRAGGPGFEDDQTSQFGARACRESDCFGIPEGYCANGSVPHFSCEGRRPRCEWVVSCPDGDGTI